ncbi:MAG: DUF3107 domain-containing protein [Nocardioidaceae bacterium]
MEVKIGVQYAAREIVIDSALDNTEVQKLVESAVADGGVLSLTDSKGKLVMVPTDKLTYVEIGSPTQGQVGFRS